MAAWILRKSVRMWVRVAAVVMALIALSGVLHLEHELDQQRHSIEDSLNF